MMEAIPSGLNSLPATFIILLMPTSITTKKGELIIKNDVCRIEDPLPTRDHSEESHIPRLFFLRLEPFLYEFTFNMSTGKASQRQLDDHPTEFPRCNDLFWGENRSGDTYLVLPKKVH